MLWLGRPPGAWNTPDGRCSRRWSHSINIQSALRKPMARPSCSATNIAMFFGRKQSKVKKKCTCSDNPEWIALIVILNNIWSPFYTLSAYVIKSLHHLHLIIITSYYPKLYFHVIPVITLLHPTNIHKSHLHPTTFLAVFFRPRPATRGAASWQNAGRCASAAQPRHWLKGGKMRFEHISKDWFKG